MPPITLSGGRREGDNRSEATTTASAPCGASRPRTPYNTSARAATSTLSAGCRTAMTTNTERPFATWHSGRRKSTTSIPRPSRRRSETDVPPASPVCGSGWIRLPAVWRATGLTLSATSEDERRLVLSSRLRLVPDIPLPKSSGGSGRHRPFKRPGFEYPVCRLQRALGGDGPADRPADCFGNTRTDGLERGCVKTRRRRNIGGRPTIGEVEKIDPMPFCEVNVSQSEAHDEFSQSLDPLSFFKAHKTGCSPAIGGGQERLLFRVEP